MDATECARRIGLAMKALPSGVGLDARANGGEIEIVLTLSDERGPQDIREQEVSGLTTAAKVTSPERFDAFLSATAAWLGARDVASRSQLYPHDVFVLAALGDPSLVTAADFAAALGDTLRREAYVASSALEGFFARHALTPPNDDAVRAVYALTPEGRASKGVTESAQAARWLTTWPWGQHALVAMMHDWVEESHDPWDVAWKGGPGTVTLLLCGAWKALEPVLRDDALRRRALAAVDRVAQSATAADLSRVGFQANTL